MPALTPGSGLQQRFGALSDWRSVSPMTNWRAWGLTTRCSTAQPKFGWARSALMSALGPRSGLNAGARAGGHVEYSPPRRTHAIKGSWGISKTLSFLAASNLTPVNTDTTLAASTVYSTNIDVTLIETLSRNSFLSVKLVWTYFSAYAVSTGVTGTRITFKIGAGTAYTIDRPHASTAVTGRVQSQEIITDVTDIFRDQWFGGNDTQTVTATIAVSTAVAAAVSGHSCKLLITYAYDPAIQVQKAVNDTTGHWRMKTMRIPVQSHGTSLTTTQQETGADGALPKTNQLPDLSTFLPEDSKNFFNVFLESRANPVITAATDFTPFVQIGANPEQARPQLVLTSWLGTAPLWTDHFDLAGFTSTNTSINWRCDLTARLALICSYITVTYAYRYDTTTEVMCEAMIPFETLGGDASPYQHIPSPPRSPCNRLVAEFECLEPSPQIKQSAFVGVHYIGGASADVAISAGQDVFRTYSTNSTIGEHLLMHRTEDVWTLRQGTNRFVVDYFNPLLPAVMRSNFFDGSYALIHYTTTLTDEVYYGDPSGGGRDPNEGGCPPDQLDAERCTRPVAFLQKTQEEAAFSTWNIDQWGKQEPRVPMLGDTWRISGALIDINIWSANTVRDIVFYMNTSDTELPACGGMISLTHPRGSAVGTQWSTMHRYVQQQKIWQRDSSAPGWGLAPERKRRYSAFTPQTLSFMYQAVHWFTVSNHRFEVLGTITQNGDVAPIDDGIGLDIYAIDDTAALDLNGNPVSLAQPANRVATAYTFGKTQEGVTRFRFEASDSFRTYFVNCNALAVPSRSDYNSPGNTGNFNIEVNTGAGTNTYSRSRVVNPL